MQIHPRPKLVATPEGIFLDGVPLHKCDLGKSSERTLSHLLCALEIHGGLTDEDWEQSVPPRTILPRVHMDIHVAMANAGLISGFSLHKEFDPNQPRDSNGRWAAVGDTGKNWLERDHIAGDDKGLRIASNDNKIAVPDPFGVPIIPSRKHPSATGSDALDDALGISNRRGSSSSSSSEFSSDGNSSSGSYDSSNDDFCKKRKQYCFSYCQYELDFPGRSGHDNMLKFRACVRKCMNDVGCSY